MGSDEFEKKSHPLPPLFKVRFEVEKDGKDGNDMEKNSPIENQIHTSESLLGLCDKVPKSKVSP